MKKVYDIECKNKRGNRITTRLDAVDKDELLKVAEKEELYDIVSITEVGVVRYYVCAIGYDEDDCVVDDDELEFGDYDTVEEARLRFAEVVNNHVLFEGNPEIKNWELYLEVCEETKESIHCVRSIETLYIDCDIEK